MKDALADYDYLCQFLEENYPLLGVAERKYGLSIDELEANYRSKIEELGENRIEFYEYYEVLQGFIGKFRELGHLAIFSPGAYQSRMREYETLKQSDLLDGHNSWRFQLFSDTMTEKRYHYLAQKYSANLKTLVEDNVQNLEFRDISADIGYVKIQSFNSGYVQEDQKKLSDWFSENSYKEYIIIDITGNNGGTTRYWADLIVAPNIDQKLNMTTYYLTSFGEESREQFALDRVTAETLNPKLADLSKLPKINKKDLSSAKYYGKASMSIEPAYERKVYNGRFFLLVDNNVFSAADSFAMFCKATGFATIVGENTRGDGGGTNVYEARLPESGLILRYRAMHGLNPDGSSNVEFGTTPDVEFGGRWGAKDVNWLDFCMDYIDSID